MKNKPVLFLSTALLALFCVSTAIFALNLPKPEGFVNDFAGIMDAQTKESISSLISEIETKTSCEIAVVTVKTIGNDTIENAAVSVFKDWGIGKKGKDNGVLILVAVDDRKVKIEVGYGLEGILPDGLCGQILDDYMVPEFKNGNYSNGIARGVFAVASTIAKDKAIELKSTMPAIKAHARRTNSTFVIVLIIYILAFLGFIALMIVSIVKGRGKRGSAGGSPGQNGGNSRSSSSDYGNDSSGDFGGGSSGGGGASRDW